MYPKIFEKKKLIYVIRILSLHSDVFVVVVVFYDESVLRK